MRNRRRSSSTRSCDCSSAVGPTNDATMIIHGPCFSSSSYVLLGSASIFLKGTSLAHGGSAWALTASKQNVRHVANNGRPNDNSGARSMSSPFIPQQGRGPYQTARWRASPSPPKWQHAAVDSATADDRALGLPPVRGLLPWQHHPAISRRAGPAQGTTLGRTRGFPPHSDRRARSLVGKQLSLGAQSRRELRFPFRRWHVPDSTGVWLRCQTARLPHVSAAN